MPPGRRSMVLSTMLVLMLRRLRTWTHQAAVSCALSEVNKPHLRMQWHCGGICLVCVSVRIGDEFDQLMGLQVVMARSNHVVHNMCMTRTSEDSTRRRTDYLSQHSPGCNNLSTKPAATLIQSLA